MTTYSVQYSTSLTQSQCDNASPACSNCARSNISCVYSENAYPSSYVKLLEERVGMLEGRLSSLDPSQADDHLADRERPSRPSAAPAAWSSSSMRESTARITSTNRLTNGLGVLSSCAAAEPHYFGFSSGLSLAHFVQAAIDTENGTESEVSLPLLADRPFSSQIPTSRTPLAPLPSTRTGSRFIRAYLSTVHPLYPFLHRKALWRMHRHLTQINQQAVAESHLDMAVLHLVYAIGARCLQLLGSSKVAKHIPEGHFISAMQYVPDAIKFTSIRSIEITLLLGLHSMRSPSGASVWHLCGLALRQCLELGLHKQRSVEPHQLAEDQRRKRLFWSVFIFERKTALVLGRPFGVSEKEIDAQIPLNVDDDEEDIESLLTSREAQATGADVLGPQTTLTLHRYHVLLYHIHTKIRFSLHGLKDAKQQGSLRDKIAARFQQLEEWKDNVLRAYSCGPEAPRTEPISRNDSDQDYSSESEDDGNVVFKRSAETEKAELLLEYYKARRSLLQPLMTEGQTHFPFGSEEYAACAQASGQICQLYRRLHRLSAVPFTLRDLHAVFVAGFTLIYCICARPTLYNLQNAGYIGACSTVLYVITEQWPSAKKYRDAFEIVVEKMGERRSDARRESDPFNDNLGSHANRSRHSERQTGGSVLSDASEDCTAARSKRRSVTVAPQSSTAEARRGSARNGAECEQYSDRTTRLEAPRHPPNGPSRQSNYDSETIVSPSEATYPGATSSSSNFFDMSLGLDLETEFNEIGGLLTIEGMDWFT